MCDLLTVAIHVVIVVHCRAGIMSVRFDCRYLCLAVEVIWIAYKETLTRAHSTHTPLTSDLSSLPPIMSKPEIEALGRVSQAPDLSLAHAHDITPLSHSKGSHLSPLDSPSKEETKEEYDRESEPSSDPIDRLGKGDTNDSQEEIIIRSGADASKYLLSLRDDDDPILTLRSVILGSAFACFQAAMNQIYNVSPGSLSFPCTVPTLTR